MISHNGVHRRMPIFHGRLDISRLSRIQLACQVELFMQIQDWRGTLLRAEQNGFS